MKVPFVTLGLAALTGGVYALFASRPDAEFSRAVEVAGSGAISYVASPALHVSRAHLLLNLALLLGFGPPVERRLKGWGLALVYVLSGAAGVGAHQLASAAPLIGASGAVSGVLGANAAARPWGRASIAVAALWGLANAAGWLLWPSAGLSYASHLGGLLAGALIAAALPSSRPPARRKAF
jgi:membrane associated rhomboid family serine protease